MFNALKLRLLGAVVCASFFMTGHSWAAPDSSPASSTATVVSSPMSADTGATQDNPYGLGALWAQGDAVAKGTLLILVLTTPWSRLACRARPASTKWPDLWARR
jgi:biopolymer transport protein ExbB